MMRTVISSAIIVVVLLAGAFYWWQRVSDEVSQEPRESTIVDVGTTTSSTSTVEEVEKLPVIAQTVQYHTDTEGYFVRPDASGDYPGVVMIHEWWGLNDNIRTMAHELAARGYQVLAVDLYDGEVATTSGRAQELSSDLDQGVATANLQSAVSYLESQNAERVASLGWCFGGGQSLELALSGTSLDATVIYYGDLVSDEVALAQLDWPVLGVFGEDDEVVPPEAVASFDGALTDLGVTHEIYMYPDVGHAFANPSNSGYAPQKAADAWAKTTAFLQKYLAADR